MKLMRLVVSDLHLGTGVRRDGSTRSRTSSTTNASPSCSTTTTAGAATDTRDRADPERRHLRPAQGARSTAPGRPRSPQRSPSASSGSASTATHASWPRCARSCRSPTGAACTCRATTTSTCGSRRRRSCSSATSRPASWRARALHHRADTYYLPEGIQIRHGHQLEHIHRVDYRRMTRKRKDGSEVLDLPWGSLWILEVLNPAKLSSAAHRSRAAASRASSSAALLFEPRFTLALLAALRRLHWLRHRIFTIRAWAERLRKLPAHPAQEIVGIGDFDAQRRARCSRAARRAHADRRPQPRAARARAAERQAAGQHRHLDGHDQPRPALPGPGPAG